MTCKSTTSEIYFYWREYQAWSWRSCKELDGRSPYARRYNVIIRLSHLSRFLKSQLAIQRRGWYCMVVTQPSTNSECRLRRVMHASARFVCDPSPRDHVTSALKSLLLPVKQRIEFKLYLLVHLTINGRAGTYTTTTSSKQQYRCLAELPTAPTVIMTLLSSELD